MLPKHVHMGRKFQKIFSSIMSFSLKHFLIPVTFCTQAASVHLKEPRNCNQKLYLYPPQKLAKTQLAFWTAIFHEKLHRHIKLTICKEKINVLFINSIHLVIFFLEIRRKLIKTEVYSTFFTLSKTFKRIAAAKNLLSSAYVIGTTFYCLR